MTVTHDANSDCQAWRSSQMRPQTARDDRPSEQRSHKRGHGSTRLGGKSRGYAWDVADTPEMSPEELAERLVRLEAQMGKMQEELGALAEALDAHAADAEVEA